MKAVAAIVGLSLFCASCASAPPPSFTTSLLSQAEKDMLRQSLSQTMKDPDAAQFKWLPVIIPQDSFPMDRPVGYCGLVNGKNSYGGYVGFKRFFAHLTRNAKGEYDRGVVEHIEGTPIGATSTVGDAMETGAVQGSCRAWGYSDFSAAS